MIQRGWIYLLRLEENTDPWQCAHKIGRSHSTDGRIKQIGLVMPYDLTLIYTFVADDVIECERMLHTELDMYRLRGEWFRPHPQWVNWFRTLSQYYLETGEYPPHEPGVAGRVNITY